MNKKGFTLVEMVIVISILSILIILSTQTINKISKKMYLTNKNQLINTIIDSVKEYALENDLDLIKPEGIFENNDNNCVYYPIDYILDEDIYHTNTINNNKLYVQDPVTKKKLTGGVKIYYVESVNNNSYKITLKAEYVENYNNLCRIIKE